MSLKRLLSSPVWKRCGHYACESKKPLFRGIASYAVIWPLGSVVQQKLEGRKELDYSRVARFLIWGSLYVAPTLTIWMTIARVCWPQSTIRHALTKALIEQVTYTPFAMTSFYFGMTLMENKGVEAAKQEVVDKFLPTYKVAVLVWPFLQTVNYTLIAEKNRVVFVSLCSLVWTTFLAYMKQLEAEDLNKNHPVRTGTNTR